MRVVTAVTMGMLVLGAAFEASGEEGSACPSRKVQAAARKAEGRLRCHEKAANLGAAVDPACFTRAETKFTEGFARAESKPPCFATGDAAAVEAQIDGFVDALAASLRPTQAASRCAAKKLRASAKKASGKLTCHRRAISSGQRVGGLCLAKETLKFGERFAAAEERPDCLTTGDGAATEAAIDDFVDDVAAALRPVTLSDCTSKKLSVAGKTGRDRLDCHRDAAIGGVAVDAQCLAHVAERLDEDFADAEEEADCYTTGDAAAVRALVESAVDDVAGQLRPALTPSKCAANKLRVAGLAYARLLQCRAITIQDGLPLVPDCVADGTEHITERFPEFEEEDPDCLTVGDAAAVLATVGAGVSSVEGALLQ